MRKIGWIGAGIMGQPMVIHLLNKGYEVHVYYLKLLVIMVGYHYLCLYLLLI